MRRQQLENRLKCFTQQAKPEFDVDEQEVYDDVREDDTIGELQACLKAYIIFSTN